LIFLNIVIGESQVDTVFNNVLYRDRRPDRVPCHGLEILDQIRGLLSDSSLGYPRDLHFLSFLILRKLSCQHVDGRWEVRAIGIFV